MLNPFPQLLFLQQFAPTGLRIAAALVLLYLAYYHYKRRGTLGHERFIVVGAGAWIPWLAALIELAAGVGLFVGYLTQWAAIVGALLALKNFVWTRRYPDFFPLSRWTSFLLLIICLSLLVTGAGLFAFDVPML